MQMTHRFMDFAFPLQPLSSKTGLLRVLLRLVCGCALMGSNLMCGDCYHCSVLCCSWPWYLLNLNLSMTIHISKTVLNRFSVMRFVRSIRCSVSKAVLLSLVTALVLLLWQRNARGATCSPTWSAAVRPPRRCSDCIQCPEVWSCDATTLWTLLASNSRADHLQAVTPRLPVSQ